MNLSTGATKYRMNTDNSSVATSTRPSCKDVAVKAPGPPDPISACVKVNVMATNVTEVIIAE